MTASSLDIHPDRGTPFAKLWKCCHCFPKKQSEDTNDAEILGRAVGDYNDDPETGMIYFDLPDENEPEELLTSPRYQAGPPIVHQFWQLLFSIFMLDWLRQNEAGKRRIRNTT